MGLFKKIDQLLNRISAVLSYCGAIWVIVLMLIIVADVGGRVWFNRPLTGTPEIVKNSIAAIAFFTMAWAAYENRHVRSTLLINKVSPFIQKLIDIFSNLIGFLLFLGIVISSWKPTVLAIKILEYEGEGALRVPTYPVRIIIIFGSLLMIWQCLRHIINTIKSLSQSKSTEKEQEGEVIV